MNKRRLLIAGGVLAVPIIAVGVWLTAPLFLDDTVDEEFPMSANAEIPDDMTVEQVEAEMEAAAEAPPTQVEEDTPEPNLPDEDMPEETAPTVLVSGEFVDADDFHQGSGKAMVYRLEDGSRVLRFEDFEVTNGPDLHVYLIPADGDMEGYVDLGSLKGNIGNQNYEIPDHVDITEFGSVIIYCVPFSVLFATAPLG